MMTKCALNRSPEGFVMSVSLNIEDTVKAADSLSDQAKKPTPLSAERGSSPDERLVRPD